MMQEELMALATGPSAPPWEIRNPGRLAWEMAWLRHLDANPEIDADALKARRLRLRLSWTVQGQRISLIAEYPDAYPRLRPQIFLAEPKHPPQRHVSPLEGNICLIGRDGRQWSPELGLGRLLQEKLEEALTGTGEEDPQGEPNEVWWNETSLPHSFMLVDSGWDLSGRARGTLNIRYVVRDGPEPELRGLVDEVLDDKEAVVATWSGAIPAELRGAKRLRMPWARHDAPLVPDRGLNELAGLLTNGDLFRRPQGRNLSPRLFGEFYCVIHPSELSFGVTGDAWLFPMLLGPVQAFGAKPRKKVKLRTVRTLRGGEADMGARVPAVRHLRGKTIAVVGVGALGGPLTLELARNGCEELRLLDYDLVEPGNSIRWPVGASAWGRRKTDALRQLIDAEYGWTTVTAVHHRIGDAGDTPGDAAVLTELVKGADVVLDCAANFGVTTALDDWCRPLGVPLLSLWATPPVTGGAAVVYRAGSGCPTCLEHHYHAGSIERPTGLGDEAALQQPAACAERTFTGGSTDLQELVLEALRITLELTGADLAAGSRIETLTLADGAGVRVPPSWRVEDLPVHPDCTWQH